MIIPKQRDRLCATACRRPHTAALVRTLQDDPDLRRLCGFRRLPHRTTFSRFFSLLSGHLDLVEECLADLTDLMADELPGFGEIVAVDSTTVSTHANPNRRKVCDPQASWTAKTAARAKSKDGKEWHFGYKYHAVVDATYGLPIYGFTTTGSRNDSPELPALLDGAASTHPWFTPDYVIADKGYDSRANHETVLGRDATPIIAIRRPNRRADQHLHEEVYAADGSPTCIGLARMEYVRSDPGLGHLYRCPEGGCHLKGRKGVLYCQDEIWEKPENPRMIGPVPRGSDRWKELYGLRQSVERVFKSAKESRRLDRHCVRGMVKVALHSALSLLSVQMTAAFNLTFDRPDRLRWMVPKVA